MIDCDEETVEITHDAERDESRCGVFCDGEPEVSFEAFGHTIHWCRECYEEPCGRCFKPIPEGTRGSTRAKGWCEDCREEVGLIVGDDERGIQKDEDSEQATLLTDGGRDTAGTLRTEIKCLACGNRAEELEEHHLHMARASHRDKGEMWVRPSS